MHQSIHPDIGNIGPVANVQCNIRRHYDNRTFKCIEKINKILELISSSLIWLL